MRAVVLLLFLAVVSLVRAEEKAQPSPPVFHRLSGDRIQAVIPGIPGVKAVTLSLVTKSQQKIRHRAHLTTAEADKTWRATLHDVTKGDDEGLTYVIQYTLQDGIQEATGSVQFASITEHHNKKMMKTKKQQQQKKQQQKQQQPEVPVSGQSSEKKRRSTVVFHEDFHSGSIDPSKWTHAITGFGGGSNQVHMLTPEPANSYVKHNTLYIKPTLTADHFGEDFLKNGTLDFNATWGGCNSIDHRGCYLSGGPGKIPPIMSAMLMSKASIRYGKVTVSARLPKGDWLWPAIWLLPKEYQYGPWPRSGEIDIMESRGNAHYHHHWTHLSMGRDYTHAAIHYGSHYDKNHRRAHSGEFRINGTTFTDGFHSFWMDWTADYIRLGVDGHTVMDFPTPSQGYWQESQLQGENIYVNGSKAAPFDRPFFLILNVSVGGGWFWEGMDNAPYPQPWQSNATKAQQFQQFWNARHLWEPTWHGENVAMKIRSVTMEQY